MKYKRLEELRKENKMSQKDVAKIIETSQQYYSKYEKGKIDITSERLKKLAIFYNVSADYILELSEKKKAL